MTFLGTRLPEIAVCVCARERVSPCSPYGWLQGGYCEWDMQYNGPFCPWWAAQGLIESSTCKVFSSAKRQEGDMAARFFFATKTNPGQSLVGPSEKLGSPLWSVSW